MDPSSSTAPAPTVPTTPSITISLTLSTTSPSFTSPTPPQLTTALHLHNSTSPLTIRVRGTSLVRPLHCTVLVDAATGEVRNPKSASGQFRGHSLRFCRANRDGFLTLYPGKSHSVMCSFRSEGARPGVTPQDALRKAARGVSLETLNAAINNDPHAVELMVDASRSSIRPFGIDGCVVGRDYVLRVKERMSVGWWRYGELEELLSMSEEMVREREAGWEREGRQVGRGERREGLAAEGARLVVGVEEGKGEVTFRAVD